MDRDCNARKPTGFPVLRVAKMHLYVYVFLQVAIIPARCCALIFPTMDEVEKLQLISP